MKYFVRRLDGTIVGPLPPAELRARQASGELTDADEGLLAAGQSHAALRRSADWRPIPEILSELNELAGVAPGGTFPPLDRTLTPEQTFLEAARARTCYPGLRTLLAFALGATLLFNLVSAGAMVAAGAAFMGLVGLLAGALVAITGYWLLQMLVDVADLQVLRGLQGLRREAETAD